METKNKPNREKRFAESNVWSPQKRTGTNVSSSVAGTLHFFQEHHPAVHKRQQCAKEKCSFPFGIDAK